MFRGILPKEFQFFDYFERHIELAIIVSNELLLLSTGKVGLTESIEKIKYLENEMDKIIHKCTEALHKTFITPIERTDIHNLIKRLDDIPDSIYSAVSRISLYGIETIRPEVGEIANILVKATTQIQSALKGLRNLKNIQYIKDKCLAIRQLENEGDEQFRAALSGLFKEADAVLIIKWKEIYERLEKAVDRCEDVANIIEGIVIASA